MLAGFFFESYLFFLIGRYNDKKALSVKKRASVFYLRSFMPVCLRKR